MSFTDHITRDDAAALIPAEVSAEVIKTTEKQSAALSLCTTTTMGSSTLETPVLAALPQAYWVDGDTGLKRPSSGRWDGILLRARELAVVVPIGEAVLADASLDIWGELRGPIATQIAAKLDAAVLSGIDKPNGWSDSIIEAATDAGQVITADSPATAGGIIGDLGELLGAVEDGGYEPDGWVAARRLRGLMRRARAADGQLLGEMDLSRAWDTEFTWAIGGTLPEGVLAVAGDFTNAVIGVRQDLTYKMFTEGVITDETGKVVLNLMQQDSAALRVVARYGFATAAPVTPDGDGFPFAVLEAGGDSSTRSAPRRAKTTEPTA